MVKRKHDDTLDAVGISPPRPKAPRHRIYWKPFPKQISVTSTGFFDLALEIRENILVLALSDLCQQHQRVDDETLPSHARFETLRSLCLTSRRVREEAQEMFNDSTAQHVAFYFEGGYNGHRLQREIRQYPNRALDNARCFSRDLRSRVLTEYRVNNPGWPERRHMPEVPVLSQTMTYEESERESDVGSEDGFDEELEGDMFGQPRGEVNEELEQDSDNEWDGNSDDGSDREPQYRMALARVMARGWPHDFPRTTSDPPATSYSSHVNSDTRPIDYSWPKDHWAEDHTLKKASNARLSTFQKKPDAERPKLKRRSRPDQDFLTEFLSLQ